MIVRSLDSSDDWSFGKGANNYLSANAAVGQMIYTRIRSFLGDCFFDITSGIDWFNLLGSKNQDAINIAVKRVIWNTQYVLSLTELNVSLDPITRGLILSYQVNTFFSGSVGRTVRFLITEDGGFLTTEDGDRLILGS